MTQVVSLINSIQTQLDALRAIVAPEITETVQNDVPVLRDRYTVKQAAVAKAEIEAAYENGAIDYDKKRGLKMLVTKRTIGWKP